MTRPIGVTAMCLLAIALVGCGRGTGSTVDTLAPLAGAPRDQPLPHGEPLQQSAPPLPGGADRDVAADHVVVGLEQYPTMAWLLSASGVLAEIGHRPVTILAPSELAFRDFAVADAYGLMANPTLFAPILRRHVILGSYDPATLAAEGVVTNLAGERMAVWRNGAQVVVDDVTLSPPAAAEGAVSMVYGADRVLVAPVGSG